MESCGTDRLQGRAPDVRQRRRADRRIRGLHDRVRGFSDKQVWGRPVGVAVAKDGSLFVTEDGNGTIWRISHQKVASNN